MTTYTDKGEKPEAGKFECFDHIVFWVGNAKQASSYYCTRLGFEEIAYKGLETGFRTYAAHVVQQNKIRFVFASPYEPTEKEMSSHIATHGDGVKDVAFTVEDIESILQKARERGAVVVKDIWEESDENGKVRMATIKTFGDTVHTFVERSGYNGVFLPGYKAATTTDVLSSKLLRIENLDQLSTTDVRQKWGKLKKKNNFDTMVPMLFA